MSRQASTAVLGMNEHNLWVSNAPGSTLFMPVGDASEQLLSLLAIFAGGGYLIVDDRTQRPTGDLAPFVRSGLLDEAKPVRLTFYAGGQTWPAPLHDHHAHPPLTASVAVATAARGTATLLASSRHGP
jgi:hypothetical protein